MQEYQDCLVYCPLSPCTFDKQIQEIARSGAEPDNAYKWDNSNNNKSGSKLMQINPQISSGN